MLRFGNKEFRNLQEQVKKNMDDIMFILQEEGVLNEFGIKVVGQEDSVLDMPTVDDYKEEHEDWSYGDAYAIGTEEPYELYILTRANGTHPDDYWFNIGEFPAPGPQGEQGPQGETGPQGPTGPSGQDGITPVIIMQSPSVTTLSAGSDATATVIVGGTIAQPTYRFDFGIPRGQDGSTLTSIAWGDITGSLSNQTDLASALQGKANASALLSYATQVYAGNVANNAQYQAGVYTDSAIAALSSIYASKAEIPSLSGYATESWVSSNFLSAVPSEYATESWVSSNFLSIDTPIGGAAQWGSISGTLSDQTDLMSKFSEYATTSEMSSAISALNYASVGALSSETYIPDITGLASEGYVDSSISALSSVYADINSLSSYATVSSLSSYATISSLSVYATIDSLSDYATVSAMSSAIDGVNSTISSLDYASVGALSSETVIPEISGTNDSSYWTSLTINEDTYDIPQGGVSGDYVEKDIVTTYDETTDTSYVQNNNDGGGNLDVQLGIKHENAGYEGDNYENQVGLWTDSIQLTRTHTFEHYYDNPDYDPEDPDSPETLVEYIPLETYLRIENDNITVNKDYWDGEGVSSNNFDLIGFYQDMNDMKYSEARNEDDPSNPYIDISQIDHGSSDSISLKVDRNYEINSTQTPNTSAEVGIINTEEAHLESGKDIFWEVENPDYDPEDPESPEYYQEQGHEAYQVKTTPDGISFIHYGYDENGDFEESVDPFDLTPVSGVNDGSNWTELTIGSETYSIPAGGSVPSGVYAELSASNTFTGNNFFEGYTGFTGSVRYGSYISFGPGDARIYGTYVGGHSYINTNCNLNVSGFLSMVGTGGINMSTKGIIFYESTIAGYAPIRNVDLSNNAYDILLPKSSGTLALQSEIPSLSEYATISYVSSAINDLDYASVGALSSATVIPDITGLASESYVDSSISALSSVYAPIGYLPSGVSGYASEVWTFVVDDGQGGSSTVSKTILVG